MSLPSSRAAAGSGGAEGIRTHRDLYRIPEESDVIASGGGRMMIAYAGTAQPLIKAPPLDRYPTTYRNFPGEARGNRAGRSAATTAG